MMASSARWSANLNGTARRFGQWAAKWRRRRLATVRFRWSEAVAGPRRPRPFTAVLRLKTVERVSDCAGLVMANSLSDAKTMSARFGFDPASIRYSAQPADPSAEERQRIDALFAAIEADEPLTDEQADLWSRIRSAQAKCPARFWWERQAAAEGAGMYGCEPEPLTEHEEHLCRLVYRHYKRMQSRDRRACMAGGQPKDYTLAEVFERDGWMCWVCRMPIDPTARSPHPGSITIDHVIEIVGRGGLDIAANVRAAHRYCNQDRPSVPHTDPVKAAAELERLRRQVPDAARVQRILAAREARWRGGDWKPSQIERAQARFRRRLEKDLDL